MRVSRPSVLPVLAQTSFTSLRGTVTDASGALIPNAQVQLRNIATNAGINGVSDSSGLFQFPQLAPGTYTITVTAPGFGPSTKQGQLLVNQPATINFQLGVVQSSQTVNVSAETQTLNNIDATIGNAFNSQTIEALPSEGRNVPDLLSLQPGVLYLGRNVDQQSDSRSGSVNGARSDQTNVTLDGLDDNNQEQGLAFTGVLRPTLDSTEEYRVATTNANADSGYSSGAQVSIVTRSGTNAFHGSLYEYNRTSLGLANDWFNKASQISQGEPNRPGKLIRNTFGAWVGGPIKKDKIFFFGTYEGQRTAENTQITRTVPTASFKARRRQVHQQQCRRHTEPLADRDHGSPVQRKWNMSLGPWRRSECARLFQPVPHRQWLCTRRWSQPGVVHLLVAQPRKPEHRHREV